MDLPDVERNPWARIIGPCFTPDSIARTLGWTREQVAEAAAALRLLELKASDGVTLYPKFQVRDGQVVEGLGAVLRVLSTGTQGPWTWAQWLNAPVDDETGEPAASAIEHLCAGQLDNVLLDARHAAATWRA